MFAFKGSSKQQHLKFQTATCVLAPHLIEVSIDILSTVLVQLRAAHLLSEAGDADDVSGLQVLGKEITARLGHVLHLIPCK